MPPSVLQQTPSATKTAAIRWCLYARKSSEQDERQALSIEQQIKEMLLLAEHWNIEISEIRKESHSSKESGTRPVYNRLIFIQGRYLEILKFQDQVLEWFGADWSSSGICRTLK